MAIKVYPPTGHTRYFGGRREYSSKCVKFKAVGRGCPCGERGEDTLPIGEICGGDQME